MLTLVQIRLDTTLNPKSLLLTELLQCRVSKGSTISVEHESKTEHY